MLTFHHQFRDLFSAFQIFQEQYQEFSFGWPDDQLRACFSRRRVWSVVRNRSSCVETWGFARIYLHRASGVFGQTQSMKLFWDLCGTGVNAQWPLWHSRSNNGNNACSLNYSSSLWQCVTQQIAQTNQNKSGTTKFSSFPNKNQTFFNESVTYLNVTRIWCFGFVMNEFTFL